MTHDEWLDAAARAMRDLWLDLPAEESHADSTARGRALFESLLATRLRAEVEALVPWAKMALREHELWCEEHDEMPSEDYESARALLAARKEEGCDCNCKPAAPGHTHGEAVSDAK